MKNTGRTFIVGGRPRQITVSSPQRMAGHGITLPNIEQAIRGANVALPSGNMVSNNKEVRLDSGRFLASVREVESLIVGVREMRPFYLSEVAMVREGPAEPVRATTNIAFGKKANSAIDPARRRRDIRFCLPGSSHSRTTLR